MTREGAKQYIREQWRYLLGQITGTAKTRVNSEASYICPFCGHGTHGDGLTRNPKSRDGNALKCFGCGFTGDIIDLYMQHYGCDYNTALQMAADELGITIDKWQPDTGRENAPASDPAQAEDKTPTEQPETDYTAYYDQCAARLSDPAAISYLLARGISEKTAEAYHLGYDPAADPASAPGATGNENRPHPCRRIIIPCTPGHYVARSIEQETPDAYKKLNPKGSTPGIFNAGVLYEDHKAVFITEGVFDALSIIEAGAQAIALNSTSNADALLKRLEIMPTSATLILCLDNDQAGQGAAETIRQGLERLKIAHTDADICAGHKDANDALKADREAFIEAVKAAQEQSTRDTLTDFLEKIQTEAYKPYKTGLSFFDDLLGGGVMRQTLLLLMAAPSAGKTTLAQQVAETMAAGKSPVIYLNFEMSREQMLAKAISARTYRAGHGKTVTEILQGYNWTEEDRQQITAEIEKYREKTYPYIQYMEISSDLDAVLDYLKGIGDNAKAAGTPAPAVVVDYLHLLTSSKGLDVQELIKQAITGLKDYAKEYDTFVIAILAANRDSNKKGRYSMESARDSSSIEYTGDYIISLNYYQLDNGTVSPTETEKISELQQDKWRQMILRLHKNRFGIQGKSARAYFHAPGNTFYGENDFLPVDADRQPFDQMWAAQTDEPAQRGNPWFSVQDE